MRWPIKVQIILLLVGIVVTAIALLTATNVTWSIRNSETEIENDLEKIALTLTAANFPITDSTLQQIKGLSGSDFVLVGPDGRASATTLPNPTEWIEKINRLNIPAGVSLDHKVENRNQLYCVTKVQNLSPLGRPPSQLYIFYPFEKYSQRVRDALLPPLITGVVTCLLAVLFGFFASSHFTKKLARLRDQVTSVADGNFAPLPVPERNDEIRDLSIAVNRMADKLQRFEGQVRSTERQRTFNQLGRAIAHEIRNAVTGSQMAIDLHRRALQKTDSGSRIETRHLDVAKKQMRSMDRAIGRFLRMGDATTATAEKVDFSGVIANVTELISPLAEHLDVKLEVNQPAEPIFAIGHPGDIEQAVINLAINAIQAAASVQTGEAKHVSIDLSNLDGQIKIKVSDSGPGPADEIAGKIFEPFESGKPDGLGLGLPLSQQIAEAHSGTIKWWREDRQTVFELTLPAANG